MWIEGEGNDDEGGDDAQNTTVTQTGAEADQGTDKGDAGDGDGGEGARQPEPSKADKALAAFEEGIDAVDGPKGADDDAAAGATGGTAAGATAAGDGKGAPAAAAAKGATAAGATGTAKTPEEEAAAVKSAKIEAEISDLKLTTEKARKRFRELSERPTWDEVTEQFKPVAELAQRAQQYQAVLEDSGANTKQVGEMFLLLKRINSGDPVQIKDAVDSMYKELKWAAAKIGVPLDAFDPIEQFPDLQQQLTEGKITREGALEIMAARRTQGMTAEQRAAANRSTQAKAEYDTRLNASIAEIRKFDASVRADPQYEAKRLAVAPTIERLKRTKVDPALWPAEIAQAWREVVVAAPASAAVAATKPKVVSPIRPSASAGSQQRPAVPKDPYAAFDMGVEEARSGGSAFD